MDEALKLRVQGKIREALERVAATKPEGSMLPPLQADELAAAAEGAIEAVLGLPIADAWASRLPRLEARYQENDAKVFEIGRWNVRVHPDGTVTQEDRGFRWDRTGDPRRAFPNMEVIDGELRLPVADLVGEVLRRIDPVELAKALWSDEDVRQAFVAEMACAYQSQSYVTDMERRQWLHDVLAAVHSQALDKATDRLASAEYAHAQAFDRYNFTRQVNAWLEGNGIDKRFAYEPTPAEFTIGGKAWNEARDDWRRLVLERFPMPVAPAAAEDDVA